MFPDISIAVDTRGVSPKTQFEFGARQPAVVPRAFLSRIQGSQSLWVPPYATFALEALWRGIEVAVQAGEPAAEVGLLFAHLGLKEVDGAAEARSGPAYETSMPKAAALSESAAQVQMLLARFWLGARLNCVARYLPSTSPQPASKTIGELL